MAFADFMVLRERVPGPVPAAATGSKGTVLAARPCQVSELLSKIMHLAVGRGLVGVCHPQRWPAASDAAASIALAA